MAEQVFGFVASTCKDIVGVAKAWKNGQLSPPSTKTPRPFPGPVQRYVLLEDLCPTWDAGGGDLLSALAVRTEPTASPVQFIRRHTPWWQSSPSSFTIGGTTIDSTGSYADVQGAIADSVVWGNQLVIDVDGDYTVNAECWFAVWTEADTLPDLLLLGGTSYATVQRSHHVPTALVERVYLWSPVRTRAKSLTKGAVVLAMPLEGIGSVVIPSTEDDHVFEGELTTSLNPSLADWSAPSSAKVQIWEPDPESSTGGYRISTTAPVTVYSRDPYKSGAVPAYCQFKWINGIFEFTHIGCAS